MDEQDEELVRWFDDELWPMITRELWHAKGMARGKGFVQDRQYWEGYFSALDMVNRFVEEGVKGIDDRVSGGHIDVDDD